MPPEKRDLNYPEARRDLETMLFYAKLANRYQSAVLGIWGGLLLVLLFFLGLSLASTWAVDNPARSGRGLFARLFCYAELYLLTGVLVIASMFISFLWTVNWQKFTEGEPWGSRLGLLAVLAGAVVTAYVGVARRWHPLARVGLYVLWAGLLAVLLRFGGYL